MCQPKNKETTKNGQDIEYKLKKRLTYLPTPIPVENFNEHSGGVGRDLEASEVSLSQLEGRYFSASVSVDRCKEVL